MVTINGWQIFICFPWEKDEDKTVTHASVQFKRPRPNLDPVVWMKFYAITINTLRPL